MSKRNGLIEKKLFSAVHFSKWLRITASGLILLGATLNVGCVAARIGKHKPIELSAAESQYQIVEGSIPEDCVEKDKYDIYDTTCWSAYRGISEDVQQSCIRREVGKKGGNLATIDETYGNGWHRGRVFLCSASHPTKETETAKKAEDIATQPQSQTTSTK